MARPISGVRRAAHNYTATATRAPPPTRVRVRPPGNFLVAYKKLPKWHAPDTTGFSLQPYVSYGGGLPRRGRRSWQPATTSEA